MSRKQILIIKDPLCLDKWEEHLVDENICDFLIKIFPQWSETLKIYHENISQENDVTPSSEEEIQTLLNLEGKFYVVQYPAGPTAIIVALTLATVAVAAIAFSGILQPSVPSVSFKSPSPVVPSSVSNGLTNRQNTSPNNQLGERVNTSRINSRIPDIFGQLRSTPDLIAVPYRIYENHQEIEISYMCIGKGQFAVEQIKDGETLVSEIAGTTVEIWAPFTSPNSDSNPQLRIGSAISEDVVTARTINGVNGQTLRPPNSDSVNGSSDIRFIYPDTIQINNTIDFTDVFASGDTLTVSSSSFSGSVDPFTLTQESVKFTFAGGIVFQNIDPREHFQSGDTLTIALASRTDGTNPVDLAGTTYTVSSVSSTTVLLSSPSGVNSDWNLLDNWAGDETNFADSNIGVSAGTRSGDLNGTYIVVSVSSTQIGLSAPSAVNLAWEKLQHLVSDRTSYISPSLVTSGDKWIGPFFIDIPDLDKIYTNFVALNGLYKDDGSQQTRFDITVEIELTPVDSNGSAVSAAQTFQGIVEGSATLRDSRALTMQIDPTFSGRCKIRSRRVTNADLSFVGNVVDEVKWQAVYGISPVSSTNFGDVTTVYAKTYATSGALAIRNRKLNMLVQRKIPIRLFDSTFSGSTYATNSADEIISFVCLDPYIGGRSKEEIDFDSIYNTIDEINAYFGNDFATQFSYTFDNDNLSFEETLSAIAESVHCVAYRQGNKIKIKSEISTENSTLIFNHRNKIPGSEVRTIRFGNQSNHDGVELEYVSPIDDVVDTYYIPTDRSALNPRKVETLGVRNIKQAFTHAWRVWNRIRYQNIISEFESTQEAAVLILKDRILVADNTRPHTQDGEILNQVGLTIALSQNVILEDEKDYIIFIQHVDGSTETIPVTAGATSRSLLLGFAPKLSLSLSEDNYARSTYVVVEETQENSSAFLLIEKNPREQFNYEISAINYTPLYYQHDRLELWLPFFENNLNDFSPNYYVSSAQGGASTVLDDVRGICYIGATNDDFLQLQSFPAPENYTKMCWVNKDTFTTEGNILSSSSTTDEKFFITSSGDLSTGHNNNFDAVAHRVPFTKNWHHVAVSYDSLNTTMVLYIDGLEVDRNISVVQRTLANLIAFGYNQENGFIGKAQDLRLYNKALTSNEVFEIFKSTKIEENISNLFSFTDESGNELTDESSSILQGNE